jgi:hypothetical protein
MSYAPVIGEFEKLRTGDAVLYERLMDRVDARKRDLTPPPADVDAPEQTEAERLYDKCEAVVLACETIAAVDDLANDREYLVDVNAMHKLDAALFPKLRIAAREHKRALSDGEDVA